MSTANILPQFVLKHLEQIAKDEGFMEYEIEQADGSNFGDGFAATLISATFVGTRQINDEIRQKERLSLMCKIQSPSAMHQEQFNSSMLFDREIYVYEKLLPTLNDLQREKGLSEENGFFNYPKCYASSSDSVDNEFVIIMNNLKAGGYGLWPKLKPIPFENVKLLMEQLGRYHGLSFVLRDQKPQVFEELKAGLQPDILIAMLKAPAFDAMFQASYARLAALPAKPEHTKFLQRLTKEWKSIFTDCVNPERAGPFAVLSHGDCWNNNLMFLNENVSLTFFGYP